MIVNDGRGERVEGNAHGRNEPTSPVCLKVLSKTINNLSRSILSDSREFNPGTPEYEEQLWLYCLSEQKA